MCMHVCVYVCVCLRHFICHTKLLLNSFILYLSVFVLRTLLSTKWLIFVIVGRGASTARRVITLLSMHPSLSHCLCNLPYFRNAPLTLQHYPYPLFTSLIVQNLPPRWILHDYCTATAFGTSGQEGYCWFWVPACLCMSEPGAKMGAGILHAHSSH